MQNVDIYFSPLSRRLSRKVQAIHMTANPALPRTHSTDSLDIANIKNFKIFATLNNKELKTVIRLGAIQNFHQGDIIADERKKPKFLWIILSGEVSVKKEILDLTDARNKQTLTVLSVGDTFGETQLVTNANSSTTAVALKDTKILTLKLTDLFVFNKNRKTPEGYSNLLNKETIYAKLIKNAAKIINTQLQWNIKTVGQSLNKEININQKNRFITTFFINILITIIIYMYTLDITKKYATLLISSTLVTSGLLSIVLIQFIYLIKTSHMPLVFFGLTSRNWQQVASDSLQYSFIIIIALILLKLFLITYFSQYHQEPLFNLTNTINSTYCSLFHRYDILYLCLLYLIFAIFQEFLIRGVIQGCLEFFSTGKNRHLMPILLSNMIFSIAHLHISLLLALIVFPFGLFWGWLYSKSRSLVGVSISHVLIGVFAGNIIGFNFILLS